MKTKILFTTLMSLFFASSFAQDRTTVNAMSSEISDNLDLRAVASIFGDSENLEDFENRLNDPKNQISNLDLNNDNQVDYLRVIESVEDRTHLIVVQSVLGRDTFQDVATLEVEKDKNNRIQVQVVGDVYMYGSNYIYEPVYVQTPIIYNYFWTPNYRPYCSSWYWNYYPSYYYAWNPCPIFRYRSHIGLYINFNHHYNYVNYRRCQVAYTNYYGRRGNGYEKQYPNRSFASRNSNYSNRYELDKTRNIKTVGDSRNQIADNGSRNNVKNENSRSNTTSRDNSSRDVKNDESRNNTNSRDVKYSETTSRDNSSRDVKYDTSRSNSNSRDIKNNETTSRNNTSRDVKYNSSTSRDNSQKEVKNETSRSNNSRSYSNEKSRDSSPRTQEQRNNSSKNSSREGSQSRSSGKR